MSRRILFLAVVAAIGGIVLFVAWGMRAPSAVLPEKDQTSGENASIVYYYGEECPHCKDVARFLEENKIAEKVSFVKKEVWHNPKNAEEMQKKAEDCDLSKENMGVPFVWTDGKCLIGGPDVEKFFKEKAGI